MSGRRRHGSEDCREIFARLSDCLDGELDPGLCSWLERHLSDCAPCEAFLESLRRTIELTREMAPAGLPEEVKRELLRAHRELQGRGGELSRGT